MEYRLTADNRIGANFFDEVEAVHGIDIRHKHALHPPRTLVVAAEFDALDLSPLLAAHVPGPDAAVAAELALRDRAAELLSRGFLSLTDAEKDEMTKKLAPIVKGPGR